jgi:S-adenosylmethionine hydrolase
MRVITLTTDFGTGDFESGVLKGVIWKIAPQVKIIDLSHAVSPQNVLEGALLLGRCTPYFPEGSIHVVVVDPGVGTGRRVMAARFGPQWFVGPDNGVATLMLERAEQNDWPVEIASADRPQYWLPVVSDVFHGRDIFSPVAAHLANGISLMDIGTRLNDPVRLDIPQPRRVGLGWHAQVMNVDHFGNLATNLRPEDLSDMGEVIIQIGEVVIRGLSQTFGQRPPGALVALINSEGFLEVAVVNGSAARRLKAVTGDTVVVLPIDRYA